MHGHMNVTFWYLSGDTKENYKTISIIGVPVQIGTGHIQQRYRMTNLMPKDYLTKKNYTSNSSSVVHC